MVSSQTAVPCCPQGQFTVAEFTSLVEVSTGFAHESIPVSHRVRLLELGLIYNLLGSERMTTAGRARVHLLY
jgi:hypothetical protein